MILRKEWRDIMVAHVDGAVPIDRRDGHRMRTVNSCVAKGWLRLGSKRFGAPVKAPQFSHLTDKGREVLCRALAEWADLLVRQQAQRFDHKFSDFADPDLAVGVLEPAE